MTLLKVKYKVTVAGKTFYPWEHEVKGKELAELKKAPYVTVVTDAPAEDVDTTAATDTVDAGAQDAADAQDAGATADDTDAGTDAQTEFTKEELEALPEEDLRALYADVQKAAGKTAPPNIGVKTIITNLLK